MYRRLIVVGNGFDLFHDINSQYSNFQDFVYNYAQGRFVDDIEKYIPRELLWSDFEKALGCLDAEELRDYHSDSLVDYGADNWSESYNHEYQFNIGEDLSFVRDISTYLLEWINNLDIDVDRKLKKTYLSQYSLYLSFNYTDTLEHVYGIPRDQILYIHGKAGENSKLIVGHGDKSTFEKDTIPNNLSEEEYNEYLENIDYNDVRENEADDIIKNYFKATYKNTQRLIVQNQVFFKYLSSMKEIFILGHSLADVDMAYFQMIKSMVSFNCQWIVSYYGEWERVHHLQQLLNLGIHPSKIKLIDLQKLVRKQYSKK